jgi:hypothetical protein
MHYVFRCLISRFCDLITNVNDSFYIIVIHIIAQYLEWSVLFRYTDSDYPFGIFKLFYEYSLVIYFRCIFLLICMHAIWVKKFEVDSSIYMLKSSKVKNDVRQFLEHQRKYSSQLLEHQFKYWSQLLEHQRKYSRQLLELFFLYACMQYELKSLKLTRVFTLMLQKLTRVFTLKLQKLPRVFTLMLQKLTPVFKLMLQKLTRLKRFSYLKIIQL